MSTSLRVASPRRYALITGASRGIGAAIALRYAQEGIQCILAGRNYQSLEKVRVSLNHNAIDGQMKHRSLVGDVRDESFWGEIKKEKHINILVNAAGITHFSPLVVTSSVLLREVLEINLLGTILGCKFVGKNMIALRGGCIINIASLLGVRGGKGSTAYAASKAGVIGLTRSLATEMGEKNVRVNVILPGYIDTEMTEAMTPDAHHLALENIPLKRFGKAFEVADAALFLANNNYANNCVLNLDGGLSAV